MNAYDKPDHQQDDSEQIIDSEPVGEERVEHVVRDEHGKSYDENPSAYKNIPIRHRITRGHIKASHFVHLVRVSHELVSYGSAHLLH